MDAAFPHIREPELRFDLLNERSDLGNHILVRPVHEGQLLEDLGVHRPQRPVGGREILPERTDLLSSGLSREQLDLLLDDVNGQKILSGEQFTPSGETYLRLLDVDLDALDEILEFVSRFGILGGAWAYAADLKALPYYEPALDLTAEWEAIKEGVLGADLLRANPPAVQMFANGELRFVETLEEHRSLAGKPQFDNAWLRIPFAETLTEFRFVARPGTIPAAVVIARTGARR